MAKRVFFSFHYQDVIDFRANVVRQHWLTKPDREAAGFFDASIWESATRAGSASVKRLINDGLDGTSVTCVLAGSETFSRQWVRYEVLKSFRKGNWLVTVHINNIKGRDQLTKLKGRNPLAGVGVTYSDNGLVGTLWVQAESEWRQYAEIEGSASFPTSVEPQYRGKGFNLARWYPEYDWVADDGYNHFASWIEH